MLDVRSNIPNDKIHHVHSHEVQDTEDLSTNFRIETKKWLRSYVETDNYLCVTDWIILLKTHLRCLRCQQSFTRAIFQGSLIHVYSKCLLQTLQEHLLWQILITLAAHPPLKICCASKEPEHSAQDYTTAERRKTPP